jgi:P27 family predicted phage terminase small subunit
MYTVPRHSRERNQIESKGLMGNPRLPRETKIIRGTFRKHREPTHTPDPTRINEIPAPPAHLRPYAKQEWKRVAAELVGEGMLTVLDLATLEICCAAYALYREAENAIYRPKKGRTQTLAQYLNGRNSQTMPELSTMRGAWQTYRSYLTEFGLAPASRGRISVKPSFSGEKDPMQELLDGT